MDTKQIKLPELRAELARRGWSHPRLAIEAGLSPGTVALAMRGVPMTERTREGIVGALGHFGAIRVTGRCPRCGASVLQGSEEGE